MVDDPEFNLDFALPLLPPLILEGEDRNETEESQKSRKTSSQLSPLDPDDPLQLSLTSVPEFGLNLSSSSRPKNLSPFGGGNWSDTPSVRGQHQLEEQLSRGSIRSKEMAEAELGFDGVFEDEFNVTGDLGIEIDEDGNVVETRVAGSPELPPMPGSAYAGPSTAAPPSKVATGLDENYDFAMNLGEGELPQGETLLNQQLPQHHKSDEIVEGVQEQLASVSVLANLSLYPGTKANTRT